MGIRYNVGKIYYIVDFGTCDSLVLKGYCRVITYSVNTGSRRGSRRFTQMIGLIKVLCVSVLSGLKCRFYYSLNMLPIMASMMR